MNLKLNYEGFENWLHKVFTGLSNDRPEAHYIFKFDNGYGASVVKSPYSYGGDRDLWELAVIEFVDGDKWEITYDTSITNDVIGYLTDEAVRYYLREIYKLYNEEKSINNSFNFKEEFIMKTLTEKTKEFIKVMDETMNACMKQMNLTDVVRDMDEEQFEIIQKTFAMYHEAKEFTLAQSKVLDELNTRLGYMESKMDLLLKKIERLESK